MNNKQLIRYYPFISLHPSDGLRTWVNHPLCCTVHDIYSRRKRATLLTLYGTVQLYYSVLKPNDKHPLNTYQIRMCDTRRFI